jgi:hypothetical protein
MSVLLMTRRAGGAAAAGAGGASGSKAFVVTRWDGSSGNVMVTGAIPLPPGTLTAATLQNFRVRDSGNTEKTIGVKALKGTFPDGSLRSVAVQFQHSVTNNTPESFTVEFGATRGTSDFTYVEPIYTSATMTVAAMNHKAVIIPDDADYWISTFVALVPLRSEANTAASRAKEWYSTDTVYDTNRSLKGWSDTIFPSSGVITTLPISSYDHGHGLLCAAIRSANRTTRLYWYQRFHDYLVSAYVEASDNYYLPLTGAAGTSYTFGAQYDASLPALPGTNDGAGLPESKTPIGLDMTTGYLMTGWSYPWRKVAVAMNRAWGDVTTQTGLRDNMINKFGDSSIRQNIAGNVSFMFAAYVIEANTQVSSGAGAGRNNNTYNWTDTITWVLDGLEQYKRTAPALTAGLMGGRPTDTEADSPNYMLLHLAKWLIFCYHNVINDSRIPTQVQAVADYLLGQMYFTDDVPDGTPIATSGAEVALVYLPTSPPYTQAEAEARAVLSPEKEDFAYGPYLPEIFGFAYAHTSNATYKTAGDRCASRRALFVMPPGTRGGGEGPTPKNFGEYFCGTNQSYLHYAAGGAIRPISGAHPTALANQTTHTGP